MCRAVACSVVACSVVACYAVKCIMADSRDIIHGGRKVSSKKVRQLLVADRNDAIRQGKNHTEAHSKGDLSLCMPCDLCDGGH